MENQVNRKQILRNTLMLYFRQILIMLVSLYTVRVVLNTLGAEDYGIYNVVAGVITMFEFINSAMASASQRFFSYDLGQNNEKGLRSTFTITLEIYLFIIILVVIFAETVGLWFVKNKLVIPVERLNSALIIFQFAIISFIVTLVSAPFMALIIAHENMSIYAYVSILEVMLKLLIVVLLKVFPVDKLVLYGILLCCVTTIVTSVYIAYCRVKYREIRFLFIWNPSLLKQIISFTGWNLFGTTAEIVKNQITNILLNLFFGPVVNAARGISCQVNNAVTSFASNFSTAVRPQIIKNYSKGNKEEALQLVYETSKYTFFLMILILEPLILEMNVLLKIWLKNVPDLTLIFTRLILIEILIDSMCYSLQSLSQATGKMRLYQSVVGGVILLNLPISYFLLRIGCNEYSVQFVAIVISFLAFILRIVICKILAGLSIKKFFLKTILPCYLVLLISLPIPLILYFLIKNEILNFVIIVFISIICIISSVYFIGLSKSEKSKLRSWIKSKITFRRT